MGGSRPAREDGQTGSVPVDASAELNACRFLPMVNALKFRFFFFGMGHRARNDVQVAVEIIGRTWQVFSRLLEENMRS